MGFFAGFSVLFVLMAFTVFAGVIVVFVILIRRTNQKNRENAGLPVETVQAKVVSKRMDVHGMSNSPTKTDYYVTFELTTGYRVEVQTEGEQFGGMVEGDEGMLPHRGTQFIRFVR